MEVRTNAVKISLAFVVFIYILGGVLLWDKSPVLAMVQTIERDLASLSQASPTPTPSDDKQTTNSSKPAVSLSGKPRSVEKNMNSIIPSTKKAQSIGIYISNSPDDPEALTTLDQVSSMGFDTVYNYASFHAPPEQVDRYLDHAQARGMKVIFSLKDLYDQLPNSNQWPQNFSYYGKNNEEIALNVVRKFKDHPATWGFSIADETPESPAELGIWQGILQNRYNNVKSITTKPVMMVLVGHTSSNNSARRSFLSSLKSARDSFALDYYPVPFEPIDAISQIANDLPAVGDNNGWFVAQSFSWSSYSSTASGLGYNVANARLPSSTEMLNMARLALNAGTRNILFYSYFDIKDNPNQLAELKKAISQLR